VLVPCAVLLLGCGADDVGPADGAGTCGACVHLTVTGAGGATQDYMATGGTLTISAVSPNRQATLADVSFEHVTITGSASTPVGHGCVSAISHLVIDSPLTN
jgi:hypothetical protein